VVGPTTFAAASATGQRWVNNVIKGALACSALGNLAALGFELCHGLRDMVAGN
jgi:hypothetical protein